MGTWGPGPFDNDTAEDWLDMLLESESTRPIKSALDATVKAANLDGERAMRAMAAAEVLLAAAGSPTGEVPDELVEWLDEHQVRPTKVLVESAVTVVERIRNEGELAELWKKDPAWQKAAKILHERLLALRTAPSPAAKSDASRRKSSAKESETGSKAVQRHLKKAGAVIHKTPTGEVTHITFHSTCGDAELEMMNALVPSLIHLALSYCEEVTDTGLESIATLTSLEALYLDALPGITDDGVQQLGSLVSLKTLSFNGNKQLTDKAIAPLRRLARLEDLDLFNTHVGDGAISLLLAIPKLHRVCVRYTDITEPGKKTLTNAGLTLY